MLIRYTKSGGEHLQDYDIVFIMIPNLNDGFYNVVSMDSAVFNKAS